jgi:F0F1-type ATP synthase assembly protein I
MTKNYGPVFRLVAVTTAWIVGPVISGAIVGRWLDRKFNSDPWLFLATIGFCFIVSMFGLIMEALKEFKKIERSETDMEKKNKNQK